MTVAELIAALTEMPQDLTVNTEGCDCWGDVASVRIEDAGECVLLVRMVCSCKRSAANDAHCPIHGS